jgi:hypothetical protein
MGGAWFGHNGHNLSQNLLRSIIFAPPARLISARISASLATISR